MAESSYHKRIIDFLCKFGEEKPKKYIKVLRGPKNPIHIFTLKQNEEKVAIAIRTRCIFYQKE